MQLLMVDADPQLCATVTEALSQAGYGVDTVQDGLTGLHRAEMLPYDLIVLEVLLPGLDGFSLCRRFGQRSAVPLEWNLASVGCHHVCCNVGLLRAAIAQVQEQQRNAARGAQSARLKCEYSVTLNFGQPPRNLDVGLVQRQRFAGRVIDRPQRPGFRLHEWTMDQHKSETHASTTSKSDDNTPTKDCPVLGSPYWRMR